MSADCSDYQPDGQGKGYSHQIDFTRYAKEPHDVHYGTTHNKHPRKEAVFAYAYPLLEHSEMHNTAKHYQVKRIGNIREEIGEKE